MLRTNEELNALIKEMKQLQAHKDDLDAQIKAIKEQIQKDMDERQEEKINTGIYKISWKLIERKDIDKKQMEKDGILDKYQKTSCYPRLDIR